MITKEILLEPGDPHFIKLVDEGHCVTDTGDAYLCNCSKPKPPHIVFRLPEVKEIVFPRLVISAKVTPFSWYWFAIYASKDLNSWVKIFEEDGLAGDEGLNYKREVLLSNDYEYYIIYWKDGKFDYEKVWLYKKCLLKGFKPEEVFIKSSEMNPLLLLGIVGASLAVGYVIGRVVEV